MKGLYVVLDQATLGRRDPVGVATAAIRGGAKAIQYRAKGVGDGQLFLTCLRLRQLCVRYSVPFFVNDRCDVALAVGASGVHLGDEDLPLDAARKVLGPGKDIGVSSHSVREALRLSRGKPDYLAMGPVFESRTKPTGRKLLGPRAVARVAGKVSCPVVAIGGVDRRNARSVIAAGASAIAVIWAVGRARDPRKATRLLVEAIKKGNCSHPSPL